MCVTDLDVAMALTRERLRSLSRLRPESSGDAVTAATTRQAPPTSAQGSTSTSTTTGKSGGSTPESLGSKEAVRTAVEAVLTSAEPADACGKYVTDHYLNVAYGGKQGCVQAQAPGSAARSLRSFRIVQFGTQGTIAVAEAVPNGGPYDGSKVVISLLFGSDHYRVDRLHSNVPVGP
jgi:hypothetical protein